MPRKHLLEPTAGPGRHHTAPKVPPVWRAPEGPEGTGGLRGAAPNEVRTPSLAGGRALRRPEHQRRRKQHKQEGRCGACGAWPRCRRAAAGPGQAHAHQAPPDWRPPRGLRGLAAVPEGGGRAWPGFETTRQATPQRPGAAGVEGAGGTGGHGRASRRGAERSEDAQPRGRPGPPAPGTPAAPQATQAGRPPQQAAPRSAAAQ